MEDLEGYLRPIPPYSSEGWERIPPIRECGEPLVDITGEERVMYIASYRRQGLSGALERCWVRSGVRDRLRWALDLLPERYSLAIFDALRPLRTQQAIYDSFRDHFRARSPGIREEELAVLLDEFVAAPRRDLLRPAPHMTGGAVDLTLALDGAPLPMGTDFDDLTERAHTGWYEPAADGPERTFRDSRRLLYHVMAAAGFVNYGCEWWHYSYGDRQWARQTGGAPIYGYCPECG